jgi:hypothetical protein
VGLRPTAVVRLERALAHEGFSHQGDERAAATARGRIAGALVQPGLRGCVATVRLSVKSGQTTDRNFHTG